MKDNTSIPRIIHYVWIGGKEKSKLANKCINSWRRYLPEYELVEWNESNINFDEYSYMREAYEAKKYAYVSDVVRLIVLYKYGGIYMDTDVEVLKSLDPFLNHEGFSGFQTETTIPTGIIGAKKENKWIKEQLDYYKNMHFCVDEVNIKNTTNVDIICQISREKHGFVPNNKKQLLKYGMIMYPFDYFCAKSAMSGRVKKTKNTYTIHHFAGSWIPKKARRHKKIYSFTDRILGERITGKLYRLVKRII